jgi:NAD(P)H dehydrogenase (quinone)
MATILVTTANGDTGRPMVEYLLRRGLAVRAMVRKEDARAQRLRDSGAEVVFGDALSLHDVRAALEGVQRPISTSQWPKGSSKRPSCSHRPLEKHSSN